MTGMPRKTLTTCKPAHVWNFSLFFSPACPKKKTKILIVEPLFPTKFFALEFFMKVIDIGNYIKNKKEYLKMFSNYVKINKTQIKKFGIGTVLIIHGYLIK